MNTSGICSNILLYLDNELKGKEKRKFAEHLSQCSECTVLVKDWEKSRSIFFKESKEKLNRNFIFKVMASLPEGDYKKELLLKPLFIKIGIAFSTILLLIGIYLSINSNKKAIEDIIAGTGMANDAVSYARIDNIFDSEEYSQY